MFGSWRICKRGDMAGGVVQVALGFPQRGVESCHRVPVGLSLTGALKSCNSDVGPSLERANYWNLVHRGPLAGRLGRCRTLGVSSRV